MKISLNCKTNDWVIYIEIDRMSIPKYTGWIWTTRRSTKTVWQGTCNMYEWTDGCSFKCHLKMTLLSITNSMWQKSTSNDHRHGQVAWRTILHLKIDGRHISTGGGASGLLKERMQTMPEFTDLINNPVPFAA